MIERRPPQRVLGFEGLDLWADDSLPGRVFEALLSEIVGRCSHPHGEAELVALFCLDENVLLDWFWGGLRAPSMRSLRPVIVLGSFPSKSFHESNPAFLTWPSHQAYIEVGPDVVAEFFGRMESMEAIDDEAVARQILESAKRGEEGRILYALHFWKDGDERAVRRDLELMRRFFLGEAIGDGTALWDEASSCLEGGRWSPSIGADFGRRFCELIRRRVNRRKEG